MQRGVLVVANVEGFRGVFEANWGCKWNSHE